MTTARSIITRGLQELGVHASGQSLDADDAQACLGALNTLADSWLTAPNYSYTSQRVSASLAGTRSLTIGPGMAFNCPRPIRLEDGCFVTVGTLDFPLRVITEAEYLGITLKDINGPWPSVCYFDGGSPTGNVFFYPTGTCTVSLNIQTQLSQFADLDTDYILPPGYDRAYSLTLSEEVAPMFSKQVMPMTSRNAKAARRDIKRANLVVPQLSSQVGQNTFLPIVSGSSNAYDGVDGGHP